MFYISSVSNNLLFGITDTDDNITEFYRKEQVLSFVKDDNFEIDGVDIERNMISPVNLNKDTLALFRQGEFYFALFKMTFSGTRFDLIFDAYSNQVGNQSGAHFRKKPIQGEPCFRTLKMISIQRNGIDSFSYDHGGSKSYRSGLTLEEMCEVMEQFSNWNLVDCGIRKEK